MLAYILQRTRLGIAALIVLTSLASAAAPAASRADQPSAPGAFFALVEARRENATRTREELLAVIASLPPVSVRAVIEPLAVPGTSDEMAGAALDVLSRVGGSRDAATTLRFLRPGLEGDLEDTIRSMAVRDPRTLAVLDELVRDLPTETRALLVRAVERVATPAAATWLSRCVERTPDVRGEALARLGRLVQDLDQPPADGVYAVVRDVLAGSDSESLRAAIVASGRMEDADAIPHLIAILRTGAMGASTDAVWSLERITGLRLGREVQRWDAWYAREQDWWREESSATFSALDHGTRAERITALLAIGKLHGWRHKLAGEVAPLLRDPDPEVARLAAQILRGLSSRYVGAALTQALERPEPAVVREAWRTLRSTTRKDLPADPAAWRALFPE